MFPPLLWLVGLPRIGYRVRWGKAASLLRGSLKVGEGRKVGEGYLPGSRPVKNAGGGTIPALCPGRFFPGFRHLARPGVGIASEPGNFRIVTTWHPGCFLLWPHIQMWASQASRKVQSSSALP